MGSEQRIVSELATLKKHINRLSTTIQLPATTVIPWTLITTFENGWHNYSASNMGRYTLDTDGVVYIAGHIVGPALDGTHRMFTMPEGCRPGPDHQLSFAVSGGGSSIGYVAVNTDGTVYVGGDEAHLEGVTYPVSPAWSTVTAFVNGWTSPSTVRYTKLASGLVVLSGWIAGGTVNQPAFTLPAGYGPAQGSVWYLDSGVVEVLGDDDWRAVLGSDPVSLAGQVVPNTGPSAILLDGVIFPAA